MPAVRTPLLPLLPHGPAERLQGHLPVPGAVHGLLHLVRALLGLPQQRVCNRTHPHLRGLLPLPVRSPRSLTRHGRHAHHPVAAVVLRPGADQDGGHVDHLLRAGGVEALDSLQPQPHRGFPVFVPKQHRQAHPGVAQRAGALLLDVRLQV